MPSWRALVLAAGCGQDVIGCVPGRDGVEGQPGAQAQRNGVAGGFAGADDSLVRHETVASDPGAEGAAIGFGDLGPQPGVDEAAQQRRRRGQFQAGDGEYDDLDGCHPGRERARVHLGQVGDQPLEAAHDAAVDHDGALQALVCGDVAQLELPGLEEVELDGGQGRLAAGRVEDLHVDLGAVEGALAGDRLVAQAPPVEHLGQGLLALVPHFGIAGELAGISAQREPVAMGGDPQRVVGTADHVEDGGHLGGYVRWRAEDVRVVELHGTHPGQAAEGT